MAKQKSSSSSTFSYSKLTLLQVHGAQERSRQSIEMTQTKSRLASAISKWRSHIIIGRPGEHEPTYGRPSLMFENCIQSTFSDREMSVFMVGRLVNLCRAEYRANVVFPKVLERLRADCQRETKVWKDRLQREEEENLQSVRELQEKIRDVHREIEGIQLRQTIQILRRRLELHHRETAPKVVGAQEDLDFEAVRKEKDDDWSSPIYVVEEPLDSTYPVASSSPHKSGDSVEWIEIDNEYFHASMDETSDWVLCL
jgi:hypothetical protein